MFSEHEIEEVKRSEQCQKSCPGVVDCDYEGRISVLSNSPLTGKEVIYRIRCDRYIAESEKKEKRREVEQQQRDIETLIASSGLIHARECVFENFAASNRELMLSKMLAIRASRGNRSVVFGGKSGTGKTHLALAIADRYATDSDKSVVFSPYISLLNDLKNSFRSKKSERILDVLKSAGCLILDDVGQEVSTEYSRELLFSLVNDRYNLRRQIVITTNCRNWDEFASKFGERGTYISRRLRAMGDFVKMEKRGVDIGSRS